MAAVAVLLRLCVALSLLAPLAGATRDVGILYEVWHSKAADSMRTVREKGGELLNTELVIRSNGTKTLNDVYLSQGVPEGGIWNVQPALGYYCLYRHRANDTSPPIRDCENITKTATAHAKMLLDAGFDYIAVDITNWPEVSPNTDLAVLRPTEVLFEEWLALRAQNVPTPAIAIWPCSPANATTWRYLMDNLYNNPKYEPLLWRSSETGKKVVFLPDTPTCYNAAEEVKIQSNGGRNDVETVRMWALDDSTFAQGTWGFFAYCTDAGQATSSMVDVPECQQHPTLHPGNHTPWEVSASGAYMLSQSGLPFANPGHLRGLTLQRLFKEVLATKAPHLFMSSFNEHIGGRQPPASKASIAFNMGLPDDPQRDQVWVDTYAQEFSRDIEPTMEEGGRIFEVATACVELYKAGLTCADAAAAKGACCTTADKAVFANAWSLTHPAQAGGSARDSLVATRKATKDALIAQGWVENCSPIPNPTAFCHNASASGANGPFMLYNTSSAVPGSIPLVLCQAASASPTGRNAAGAHFLSNSAGCDTKGTMVRVLGYMAPTRGAEMLRALRRCRDGPAAYTHAVDVPCEVGARDSLILGFVR